MPHGNRISIGQCGTLIIIYGRIDGCLVTLACSLIDFPNRNPLSFLHRIRLGLNIRSRRYTFMRQQIQRIAVGRDLRRIGKNDVCLWKRSDCPQTTKDKPKVYIPFFSLGANLHKNLPRRVIPSQVFSVFLKILEDEPYRFNPSKG